jgi:hypothetical protein
MKPQERSSVRVLVLGFVALLLFAAAMHGLERLLPTAATPGTGPPTERASPPLRPELRVRGDTVAVEFHGHHLSTVTLDGDPDGAERLGACIEAGIERVFGAERPGAEEATAPDGWYARRAEYRRVSAEVQRITDGCLRDTVPALLPGVAAS